MCSLSKSRLLPKVLKNRPRKPHGIKSRISMIGLFHNVWAKCHVEAALYRTSRTYSLGSREVEAIEVHHLAPGCHEVTRERLLRVGARKDFRDGPELGV